MNTRGSRRTGSAPNHRCWAMGEIWAVGERVVCPLPSHLRLRSTDERRVKLTTTDPSCSYPVPRRTSGIGPARTRLAPFPGPLRDLRPAPSLSAPSRTKCRAGDQGWLPLEAGVAVMIWAGKAGSACRAQSNRRAAHVEAEARSSWARKDTPSAPTPACRGTYLSW